MVSVHSLGWNCGQVDVGFGARRQVTLAGDLAVLRRLHAKISQRLGRTEGPATGAGRRCSLLFVLASVLFFSRYSRACRSRLGFVIGVGMTIIPGIAVRAVHGGLRHFAPNNRPISNTKGTFTVIPQ